MVWFAQQDGDTDELDAGLAWARPPAVVEQLELSAAVIRPEQWAFRRWFYGAARWYYHAPGVNHRTRRDDRFYGLIDLHLRSICRMLHETGLRTTASCEGHFHERSHYEEAWDQLQRERDRITGPGLIVHDAETDLPHLVRDEQYALPWENEQAFCDQAQRQQSQGFLGMVVPQSKPALARQLNLERYRTPFASIVPDRKLGATFGGWGFAIAVKSDSPSQQAAQWHRIHEYLDAAIRESTDRAAATLHFDRTLLTKR